MNKNIKDTDYIAEMTNNDILKERKMFGDYLGNGDKRLIDILLDDEDLFAFISNFDPTYRNLLSLVYKQYMLNEFPKCVGIIADLENLLDLNRESQYIIDQLMELKKKVSTNLFRITKVSTFKPLFEN